MLTDRPNAKGLQLFYAAVPLLISFIMSIVSFFAAVFIRGFYYHTNLAEEKAADDGIVYLINYGLQIIIFGFWYLTMLQRDAREAAGSRSETSSKASRNRSEKKDSPTDKKSETASAREWHPISYWAKRLPLLIVLGYALQLAVSGIISVLSSALPSLFSAYKELVQSLAGESVDWLTFAAVSFLAPIGEELLFRGVTYRFAKKALPVRWAILFQAALFGIYHLNLVQFFYAVAVGYLLGMLAEQAGSVIPGIVLHIIINLSAYLVPAVFLDNIPKAAFTAVLSIVIAIPCCILLLKKPAGTRK